MTSSVAMSYSDNVEQQLTKLVFLTYDELPNGDPDDLKVLARAGELGLETGVLDWRKVELGAAHASGNDSVVEIDQEKSREVVRELAREVGLAKFAEAGREIAREEGQKAERAVAKETTRARDSSTKGRTVYVLRSTWNYHLHYEQFQDFLEHFLGTNELINDAQLVLWNTDKRYLQDLAWCGVSVAPTLVCSGLQFARRWILKSGAFSIGDSSRLGPSSSSVVSSLEFPCSIEDFTERINALGWLDIVVKPAIGLSSYGVKRFQLDSLETAQQEYERAFAHAQECATKSPVLVQPYLASVTTLGERCLVFIDGKFSHAIMKKPFQHMAVAGDAGETKLEATAAEVEFASRVLAQLPIQPLYARVDIVPKDQGTTCEQVTRFKYEASGTEPESKLATGLTDTQPEFESKLETSSSGTGHESKPEPADKQAASEFYLLELELVEPSLYFCFKEDAVTRLAEAISLRCGRNGKS